MPIDPALICAPDVIDLARARHDLRDVGCQKVSTVLSRIGDKWSILIIVILSGGPTRFSELKRAIDGISQRMLTLSLRGLEREGLVKRTIFPTVPARVEYELTPLGWSICQPVIRLCLWTREHMDEIEQARRAYDERAE